MAYKQKGIDFGNGTDPVKKGKDKKKAVKSTESAHGQLNDAEAEYQADLSLEQKEDAAGVDTNIKTPKVHKDGSKNRVHGVKNPGNWKPNQFKK